MEIVWEFRTAIVEFTRWRCVRQDPRFERERSRHSIVFLHGGSFRVHSSQNMGLLDCTRAAFFNSNTPFRTTHPFGGGDRGSELAIRPDVLAEIVARTDPSAADREDAPFSIGSGPCDPRAFLQHRTLAGRILRDRGDALAAEEVALSLVHRLVAGAFREATGRGTPPLRPTARDRAAVEEIRSYFCAYPGRRHRLDDLAAKFDISPFRLCRAFPALSGSTLHRNLVSVRLRTAVDRLADGCRDIADLALELGFSGHSHFSSSFQKAFGTTPESVRRGPTLPTVRSLAAIV